jgi:hypothetical protein
MGRTPTNPSPNLPLPPAAPTFTAAPQATPAPTPVPTATPPRTAAPSAQTPVPTAGTLQTGAPAGAVAPAPGMPDYTFVTMADGRPGIVRGGWIYPRQ